MLASDDEMAPCARPCRKEEEGAGLYESGPVRDDEWLCRSIRPKDFKSGEAKPGFIQSTQLKKGSLSAWRIEGSDQIGSVAALASGADSFNMLAARVSDLRSITFGDGGSVCVINDTRTSEDGDHHPLHAAISGCVRCEPWTEDEKSRLDFLELRTKIILAFRKSGVTLHPLQG